MPAKMQTQLNRVAVKHVPMNQVWQPQLCVYHKFFKKSALLATCNSNGRAHRNHLVAAQC
jgi:hypothetical protein